MKHLTSNENRKSPYFEDASSKSIIFTNRERTIAFQTRRALDIVLVNKPINPRKGYINSVEKVEWKFVIHTPMELVFGLCKKSDVKLAD